MAKADVKMPDEFLAKLSRLGSQTDTFAEKVLQAGGEVALDKVRSNLKAVVGSGNKGESRSTGELERSLGLSPVMVDKNGNYDIKVGFSEPRTDGASNAKIANILECSVDFFISGEYTYKPGKGREETLDDKIMDKLKYCDINKKARVLKMIDLL